MVILVKTYKFVYVKGMTGIVPVYEEWVIVGGHPETMAIKERG
jgi:hypothetical protein